MFSYRVGRLIMRDLKETYFKFSKFYLVNTGAQTFNGVAVQNISNVFMLYRCQRNKTMLQENEELLLSHSSYKNVNSFF